jgi:hypothetical protein
MSLREQFAKVQVGMTRDEVEAIMGQGEETNITAMSPSREGPYTITHLTWTDTGWSRKKYTVILVCAGVTDKRIE